jgi:Protein of unknown function (DUF3667)
VAHTELRTDKTCLNCGFHVEDRYCSHCGQENTQPAESLGHLIGHFLSDITHYDSKFLTSLKDLLFKPGFLTLEYIEGKRNSYLNPIRMYIFISAVFFIILFGGSEQAPPIPAEAHPAGTFAFSQHLADSLRSVSKSLSEASTRDSIRSAVYMDLAGRLDTPVVASQDDESLFLGLTDLVISLTIVENKYHSIHQYDSIQAALPDSSKETAFQRFMTHRMIKLRLDHPGRGPIVLTQNVGEDIPKIMFVILPLFALYAGFFYRRKKYVYTQQLIFSLHFHCFVFIALSILILLGHIPMGLHGVIALGSSFLLLAYIYLSLALSRVYQQTLWLSAIKATVIGILYISTILGINVGIGISQFVLG